MVGPKSSGTATSDVTELSAGLVLMADKEDRFLLPRDQPVVLPRITLHPSAGIRDLAELVENLVAGELGIRSSYMRLLACEDHAGQPYLVFSVIVRTGSGAPLSGQELRWYSYDEILRSGGNVPESSIFAAALRMRAARVAATDLEPTVRRAFTMAVDYLTKHLSTEGTLKGWDQYQDGSTIGVLSTAQGLLCHVHAGHRGNLVTEAAETLERLQNPDGGWQVRRALIGEQSEISITESTCYCLWALHAAGRSELGPSARKAIEWLETTQGADGGWRSSPRVPQTQVGASAAAVTQLSRYSRTGAVTRGADWLRSAQCPDGGWGPTMPSGTVQQGFTSPAYTAHVIIALLASGATPADDAVRGGCSYLEEAFDTQREEPWRPTSFNTMVDPNTSARLEFRHFATPWAIAALAMAGRGIGDPLLLEGVNRLLALQDSAGAWRCELTAPDARPIWATHDALYALRAIISTADKKLHAVAMEPYWTDEQRALGRALVRLIGRAEYGASAALAIGPRAGRRWLQTAWLSLLTTLVAVILLEQFGVLRFFKSGTPAHRVLGIMVTAVVAFTGATLPLVAAEEYKVWRMRHAGDRGGNGA
jgi:hypothetical protein